jgi:hypothetical protein
MSAGDRILDALPFHEAQKAAYLLGLGNVLVIFDGQVRWAVTDAVLAEMLALPGDEIVIPHDFKAPVLPAGRQGA